MIVTSPGQQWAAPQAAAPHVILETAVPFKAVFRHVSLYISNKQKAAHPIPQPKILHRLEGEGVSASTCPAAQCCYQNSICIVQWMCALTPLCYTKT